MGLNQNLDELAAPEKLDSSHQLKNFDSGNIKLDDWLRRHALRNEVAGASRTYVLCASESKEVIAYYCLANGAVAQTSATGRIRRNMPDPIPVMVIGRLAVESHWQGKGIGRALLRDAILRVLQAAEIAGIRAIIVHAISENAKHFYEKYGFVVPPIDPMMLMLKVSDAETEIAR